MVPAKDTDPCFCYRNSKNELKALTYSQLSEKLKNWVTSTGCDGSMYTLHGMRRGSMTHMFNSGIDSSTIKLVRDWCSDTFLCYIDLDIQNRVKASVNSHRICNYYSCLHCRFWGYRKRQQAVSDHPLRLQLLYQYKDG